MDDEKVSQPRHRRAGRRLPRRSVPAVLLALLLVTAASVTVALYSPAWSARQPVQETIKRFGYAPGYSPEPSPEISEDVEPEDEAEEEDEDESSSGSEPRRNRPGRDSSSPSAAPVPPVPSEFPNASNTGVRDGVQLRQSRGVDVHEDGAVIENLLIVDGSIEVYANNVTIRNVRITNTSRDLLWGILQRSGYSGLVVEDSEIFGSGDGHIAAGITNHGGMITIRRVEIHTVSDAVNTETGLLEDSYLHSPAHVAGDHNDMVQANGGPAPGHSLEIRHNTIINTRSQTGAISLFANFSEVRNVKVINNFLAGGGYTVYGGGLRSDGRSPANIVIQNNVFSRKVFPKGGYYGPVAHFDPSAPGNVWSGNVWEDGTPVRL